MKSVLLFLSLTFMCVQVSAKRRVDIIFDAADEACSKELDIDLNYIERSVGENFKLEEDNETIKKFMGCSWKKGGYINDFGFLDKAKIKKWITNWDLAVLHEIYEIRNVKDVRALIDRAVEICSSARGRDAGEVAVKTHNCLIDFTLLKQLF